MRYKDTKPVNKRKIQYYKGKIGERLFAQEKGGAVLMPPFSPQGVSSTRTSLAIKDIPPTSLIGEGDVMDMVRQWCENSAHSS